jgi:hypothetical protein
VAQSVHETANAPSRERKADAADNISDASHVRRERDASGRHPFQKDQAKCLRFSYGWQGDHVRALIKTTQLVVVGLGVKFHVHI